MSATRAGRGTSGRSGRGRSLFTSHEDGGVEMKVETGTVEPELSTVESGILEYAYRKIH